MMSFPGDEAFGVAGRGRSGQAATRAAPGGRGPGRGIVAVVTWKAFRAAVRRCRRRVRGPGGRDAGLPVLPRRAAEAVGTRPGAGGPPAGRRDGAAAPAAGVLRLLPPDPGAAAVVVRAGAGRRDRGHRHRGRDGAGRGGTGGSAPGWASRPRPCAAGCAVRSRAEAMRQDAMHQLGFVGGLAGPPLPGPAARRSVTRSTPSPPARTPPSPAPACPGGTCGRCWAGRPPPAISPPPRPADPSRQPGHRYACGPAATLAMTTTAPFPALSASP